MCVSQMAERVEFAQCGTWTGPNVRTSLLMGAVRVAFCGGGEDVFADEQVGGEADGVGDTGITLFHFRYDVSADRSLTVTVTQLFHDRRYSPVFHPIGCVQVASYRPSEWVTVTKG